MLSALKFILRKFLRIPRYTKSFRFFQLAESLWWGNTVSSSVNRECFKNWKKAKKNSPLLSTNLHKQFLKNGYASLGHVFSLKDIESLQMEFEEAINSEKFSESPYKDPKIREAYNHGGFLGDVEEYRRDIKDCEKSLPTVKKLLKNQKFKNLISEIIGCQYYELSYPGILAWRNYHVPSHISNKFEIITNRFHFDSQLVDRFKIFIYLSDVSIEDGPFQHFPKSYSRTLLLKGFQEEKRKASITCGLSPSILNSPKLIKHVGKAGHVLVCATSFCLHRAGEVAPGHWRDLLQISIRPKQNAV